MLCVIRLPSLHRIVLTQKRVLIITLDETYVMNPLVVSASFHTENSHCAFSEDKYDKNGDSFGKVAQLQRTDTRRKTYGQTAHFRGYQRTHTGAQTLECGKNELQFSQ